MADPREIRNRRLTNEYNELMQINGPIIQIEPLGNEPYERYKITFNIRTIISPAPSYRNKTVCILIIPPRYPKEEPTITAETSPYPWHINWFSSGRWCFGGWNQEESLVSFIHRCARTLQFDPEITNPGSVANRTALPFWDTHKHNRQIIPSDIQVLPTLDVSGRITIIPRVKPKIVIKSTQADKPKINIINRNNDFQ